MTLKEEDRQILIGALDSLGTALTEHHHEWTDGERGIYEQAIIILRGYEPPKFLESGEEQE